MSTVGVNVLKLGSTEALRIKKLSTSAQDPGGKKLNRADDAEMCTDEMAIVTYQCTA